MKTHVEMLKEMGVSSHDADQYIEPLEEALPKYGIAASKLRLATSSRRCCTSPAACASTWRT